MTKILDKMPEPPLTEGVEPEQPVKKKTNMRDCIEEVFEKLGGTGGMKDWVLESTANKRIFYRNILPKIIPKEIQAEVAGKDGGPLIFGWAGVPTDVASPEAMKAAAEKVAVKPEDDNE